MYGFTSIYSICFIVLLAITPAIERMSRNTSSPKAFRVLVLFLLMAFFSAFRAPTVGGDLEYYIPHFEEICQLHGFGGLFNLNVSNYEPGYTLFCWGLSRITKSNFVFLALTGVISLIGPFSLCKRYSPWPFFSILLYILLGFYTNTFNNIRQSLALSFIFLAIPYVFRRKFFRFLLLTLLAASFHASAVFFIVAYPLFSFHLSKYNVIPILGISFLASLAVGAIIVQYFGGLFLSKYEEIEGSGAGRGMLLLYVIILTFSLFFFDYNKHRLLPRRRRVAAFFIKLLLVATVIQMFAVYFSSIYRMTYYFFIPIIALVPILLTSVESKARRSFYGFLVLAVLFCYMSLLIFSYLPEINSNPQGVIPYRFYF